MRSVAGEWREPISDDVAHAVRDELDAAQDERAHEDLAELGVGLHQRLQGRRGPSRPPRPPRRDADAEQRAAARQHVHLAGELAGTVFGDQRLAVLAEPHDLELPLGHDEEGDDRGPFLDEHFPRLDRARRAVRGEARDLGGCESRKNVVGAGGNLPAGEGRLGFHRPARIIPRILAAVCGSYQPSRARSVVTCATWCRPCHA